MFRAQTFFIMGCGMKIRCANNKVVGFMSPNLFLIKIKCGIKIGCANKKVVGFMSLSFFFNNNEE